MTGSPVCTLLPDVCYFTLSKSISLLLMAAQRPVSFCCISCLVVCKCRSKHTGIETTVIVFDTRYQAGQRFVTRGQPLFSLHHSFQKSQRGLPLQHALSKKLSVRQLLTNLWHVFVRFSFIFLSSCSS